MVKSISSQQVIELLKDGSFPSIVLLNGPWGSGKTHLTKEYLIPDLKRTNGNKVHYISLYGITSLEDFRDKILSKNYTDSSKSATWGSSARSVIGGVASALGDRGATRGILNALAKPIKHKLLAEVKNVNIIIDDLERASNQTLVSEVLGECLNFAENNANVWIVVIANTVQIEDKSLLEKTFLNRVSINPSSDDIMYFIDSQFPDLLCDVARIRLKHVVDELQLANYRVIQRILQRYTTVQRAVIHSESIDQSKASVNLIDSITRICHAHYEHNFSFNELCRNEKNTTKLFEKIFAERANEKLIDDKEDVKDERQQKLDRILSSPIGRIPKAIVIYSLGLSRLPDNIIEEFELPLASSYVDRVISYNFRDMDEKGLIQATKETVEFILGNNSKSYSRWIRALDSYTYLVDYNYVNGDVTQLIDNAKKAASIDGFFEPMPNNMMRNRYLKNLYSEQVRSLNKELLPTLQRQTNRKINVALQESFLNSWSETSTQIYQSYDNKPFLNDFELELVIDGILNNWNVTETIIFGQYLEARYKISNIYEYLAPEFRAIKELKIIVEKRSNSLDSSMKKGLLSELLEYLEKAVLWIEKAEKRAVDIGYELAS